MANGTLRLRIIGCLLLGMLGTGCAQESTPPDSQAGLIQATELNDRIAAGTAPLILDVREADEFAAGHLPGAVNIPHSEIVSAPDSAVAAVLPDKGMEVVVYCASGRRSGMAQDAMNAAGYSLVRHLAGRLSGLAGSRPARRAKPLVDHICHRANCHAQLFAAISVDCRCQPAGGRRDGSRGAYSRSRQLRDHPRGNRHGVREQTVRTRCACRAARRANSMRKS